MSTSALPRRVSKGAARLPEPPPPVVLRCLLDGKPFEWVALPGDNAPDYCSDLHKSAAKTRRAQERRVDAAVDCPIPERHGFKTFSEACGFATDVKESRERRGLTSRPLVPEECECGYWHLFRKQGGGSITRALAELEEYRCRFGALDGAAHLAQEVEG